MSNSDTNKSEDHIPIIPKEFDDVGRKKNTQLLIGHLNETIPKPYEIPKHPKLKRRFRLIDPDPNNIISESNMSRSFRFMISPREQYSLMNLTQLLAEKIKLENRLKYLVMEIKKRK